MGRKRWWQGGLVELLVVLRILHHAVVLADGDVGECDRRRISLSYGCEVMAFETVLDDEYSMIRLRQLLLH